MASNAEMPLSPAVCRLPFDVILQIIKNIPRKTQLTRKEPRLSPLATVSRQWQDIVESILFRDIEVKFAEFKTFAGMFSQNRPWRRALLKTFDVKLEDIQSIGEQLEFDKDSANENPEVPNLTEYNNRLLSSIREVWEELHSWGVDLQLLRFYLTIQIHPFAEQVEGWAYMIPRIPYIHLIEDENQLPALQLVQEFHL
jgi:F-box-like